MDSTYNSTYVVSSSDSTAAAAVLVMLLVILLVITLIIVVPSIIGLWKVFTKAGKPGWAAIVPVYNVVVWCEIVGRPVWWIALFFVPLVNIFANLALSIDLAKSFGKDMTFGILTWLFSPVMLLILAFSKDVKYVGPVAEGTDMFSSFTHQSGPAPATPQQPENPFTSAATVEPVAAETPVGPVAFEASAAPETPVAPVAPVVSAPTVSPVGPVAFEAPATAAPTEAPVQSEGEVAPSPESDENKTV